MTNFKSLKAFVIFTWLTLMPAPFQSGKNVPMVFSTHPPHPLSFMGKPRTHFPATGELSIGAYHTVHISVIRIFGINSQLSGFLAHINPEIRGSFAQFSHSNKNIGTNCTLVISYQGNLQAVDSFYYLRGLLSCLHFSHQEKHCDHAVFHTIQREFTK